MLQRPHHAVQVRFRDRPREITIDNANDAAHSTSCRAVPSGFEAFGAPSRRSRTTLAGVPTAIANSGMLADHHRARADDRIAPDREPSVTTTCAPSQT